MWDCLVKLSTWAEGNSGQIQITIALIALYYVYYQIKLFKEQRYLELRLQLIDFICEQLEIVRNIKLSMLKVETLAKDKSKLAENEIKLLNEFQKVSHRDSTKGAVNDIEKGLNDMLKTVYDAGFTIKELEMELKESIPRIENIKNFHDQFNTLLVKLNK